MHTRRLQVKNGRLVVDEPTDLPEGAEVEVLVMDDELVDDELVDDELVDDELTTS
jgi:hypothetical protein